MRNITLQQMIKYQTFRSVCVCALRNRCGSRTLAPSTDVTPSKRPSTVILQPFLRRTLLAITTTQLPQSEAVVPKCSRALMMSTARRPSPLCHCSTYIPGTSVMSVLAAAATASSTLAMIACRHRQLIVPSQHWSTYCAVRHLLSDTTRIKKSSLFDLVQ